MDRKKFSQETVLEFNDGEIVFQEGDPGQEMFIIQRGSVRIAKKSNKGELELAVMRQGDFFGEMTLLESEPRNATAYAQGKTTLLLIPRGGFLLKIRRDPTFGFEIMQSLSRRIRDTNERLIDQLGEDQREKILAAVAEAEYAVAKLKA